VSAEALSGGGKDITKGSWEFGQGGGTNVQNLEMEDDCREKEFEIRRDAGVGGLYLLLRDPRKMGIKGGKRKAGEERRQKGEKGEDMERHRVKGRSRLCAAH